MNIRFLLNGKPVDIDTDPLVPLTELLRERFNLQTLPIGCGSGTCGRCVILIDHEPALGCLVPAFAARGRMIVTYEGFRGTEDWKDIDDGFTEAGFFPCEHHKRPYVFLVHSLLEKISHPDADDTAALFRGFHPVCGGYSALLEGVNGAAVRRFLRHNEQAR